MCVQPSQEPPRSRQLTEPMFLHPARILWLHRQESTGSAIEHQLLVAFQKIGARLEIEDAASLTSKQLAQADLVLMDAFEQMETVVETLVSLVRIESRVPLIVLTRKHSIEQLVMALQAGADAIWSLDSAPSVLLAHCQALLRRWQSGFRGTGGQ